MPDPPIPGGPGPRVVPPELDSLWSTVLTLLYCFVRNARGGFGRVPNQSTPWPSGPGSGREEAVGRDLLGELEHQVMLALLQLGEEAYTAPVVLELRERTGHEVTTASVYVVLRRLEEKGLVASELGDPGPGGGRDRRYFRVTEEGLTRLRDAREAYTALWEGLAVLEPRG